MLADATVLTGPVAGLRRVAHPLSRKLYRSALKATGRMASHETPALTESGLREGINVSRSGMEKAERLVERSEEKIQPAVKAASIAGVKIPASEVANVDRSMGAFGGMVKGASNRQPAIQEVLDQFLTENQIGGASPQQIAQVQQVFGQNPQVAQQVLAQLGGGPQYRSIPIDELFNMVRKEATILSKTYGEQKGATTEAFKDLRHAGREAIGRRLPAQVGGEIARQRDLLRLSEALMKRIPVEERANLTRPLATRPYASDVSCVHGGPELRCQERRRAGAE